MRTADHYETFTIGRQSARVSLLESNPPVVASVPRVCTLGTSLRSQCNFPFLASFSADYVRKYATEEALRDQENGGTGNGMSSDSESSMSDFSEDEAQDMEL